MIDNGLPWRTKLVIWAYTPGLEIPDSAEDAARIEKQAHLFAGAFLAPGDAVVDELQAQGGRVTLATLSRIKERWGISIKALVMRFRNLGVIDAETARSLYKQISARGWNKAEPVPVGNEAGIWFSKAVERWAPAGQPPLAEASFAAGIGFTHLQRWTDWSPTHGEINSDGVVDLAARRDQRSNAHGGSGRLPM